MRPLDQRLIADLGFQQRFPDEIEALSGLDEPWLAVPDAVVADAAGRITAVVGRTVGGPRLAALIERHPRGLDAQIAALIAMDVLSALSALHERRVAQRGDLADHVVITEDGTCVVVDTGLAPRLESEGPNDAIIADLRGFAQLLAHCLYGQSAGHRAASAARTTHRSRELPEALQSLLDHARTYEPGLRTAAVLLADLGASAAQEFDAGWDVRARERLAQASRSLAGAQAAERDARPAAAHPRPVSLRPVSLPKVVAAGVAVLGSGTGLLLAITSRPDSPPTGSPPPIYQPLFTAPGGSATGTASAPAVTAAGTSPTPAQTQTPTAKSISLASPSAIAATTPGTSATPSPTATPVSYEADASSNILNGGAKPGSCSGCPDGAKIRFIGNGGTLTFPDVVEPAAGSYTLVITYVNGGPGREGTVTVDGTPVSTLYFPGNSDWNSPQTFSLTVRLSSGSNSIEFSNPSSWAPDIAEITV